MLRLADFAVTVADAKAAADWWQKKVGFEVHTIGAPGGHAVLVAPPGERFVLHLCAGIEPVEPGNSGIAFMTDDIEAQVRRMEKAGVIFPEALKKESWGSHAKFSDPDGNIFWLLGAPSKFIREETGRIAGGSKSAGPKARPKGRKPSRKR
jgi:predicted enzyme related to lactoylglutathione lyase